MNKTVFGLVAILSLVGFYITGSISWMALNIVLIVGGYTWAVYVSVKTFKDIIAVANRERIDKKKGLMRFAQFGPVSLAIALLVVIAEYFSLKSSQNLTGYYSPLFMIGVYCIKDAINAFGFKVILVSMVSYVLAVAFSFLFISVLPIFCALTVLLVVLKASSNPEEDYLNSDFRGTTYKFNK